MKPSYHRRYFDGHHLVMRDYFHRKSSDRHNTSLWKSAQLGECILLFLRDILKSIVTRNTEDSRSTDPLRKARQDEWMVRHNLEIFKKLGTTDDSSYYCKVTSG
jgi:hypothetical protein